MTVSEFYSRQQKGEIAKTTQISHNAYTNYFEEELKKGRDIIVICLSSGLSASFSAAQLVAEKMMKEYPERKIYCIDSISATLAEGVLVYAAVQKKRAGLPVDEVAEWLKANNAKAAHLFTVDELDSLKRGGRISAATAAIGSMLNIKPVLHISGEGKIVSVNKARGRKKSLELLAEMFKKQYDPSFGLPVYIGHGAVPEDAQHLKELVIAGGAVAAGDIRFGQVGPVIGAHSGPSIVGIFFFGDNR
jgi:DegV family protein with EDD domain